MPPVASSRRWSVTFSSRLRVDWLPEKTRTICTVYSAVSSLEMVVRIVAGPVLTWRAVATGTGVPARRKSGSATVPKMPPSLLIETVPTSRWTEKSPFSSPGSPLAPFFTAFTVVSMMEPQASGISCAVSTSVMPWPSAP